MTGFSQYISNYHFLDSIKLLHHCPKGKPLNIVELLEIQKPIKKGKNVRNDMLDLVKSPFIDVLSQQEIIKYKKSP